ncbi:MAG: nucleoside triphosphate pyrophosphohydrolase [Bacteroidota bacterium]
MPDNETFPDAAAALARLMDIVDELRQKCPWDMKQTKESIRHLTIEETYELSDAILADDHEEMKVELGDLLMHLVFYASMARDAGKFDLREALEYQIAKLIRRHPHIYGDMVGASEDEINANWEKIKAQERASQGTTRRSALAGVPKSLPALIQAQRMQEKASGVGFDWDNADDVWDKVLEEMTEFELAEGHDRKEAEMGDLLFALVNYCRHQGINPEDALARTNRKFQYRFHYIEKTAWYEDKEIEDLSMEEMDRLWEEAKKDER